MGELSLDVDNMYIAFGRVSYKSSLTVILSKVRDTGTTYVLQPWSILQRHPPEDLFPKNDKPSILVCTGCQHPARNPTSNTQRWSIQSPIFSLH